MLSHAHAVCKKCGNRWEVSYRVGQFPPTQNQCKTRECDAGWMDIPVFMDKADAERCAAEHPSKEVA